MDTPELSPNPSTLPASDGPPWQPEEATMQLAVPRRQMRAAPEMVHWWVVALTLLTGASVLFGSHSGSSRPRELLPVVMIAS